MRKRLILMAFETVTSRRKYTGLEKKCGRERDFMTITREGTEVGSRSPQIKAIYSGEIELTAVRFRQWRAEAVRKIPFSSVSTAGKVHVIRKISGGKGDEVGIKTLTNVHLLFYTKEWLIEPNF